MPYKNLKDYTTILIKKDVHKKIRNYANLCGKPLNILVMEALMDVVEHTPVDKFAKGYIPRVY